MTKGELFTQKHPLAVAIDFDGTITDIDVVDGILVQFTANKDWITIESEWVDGKISSDECLRRQLDKVRVTHNGLKSYLATIQLDPGFKDLKDFLDQKGIPLVVLSDGFDLLIKEIFRIQKIENVVFRSNELAWKNHHLVPSFPYKEQACSRCAHCKRTTLLQSRKWVERFIFIGDGLSDVCAMDAADTVFAKGKLEEYCQKNKRPSIPFRSLSDVTLTLPQVLDEMLNKVPGIVSS